MEAKMNDYSKAIKTKVGLEALKDLKTIGDLALEYKIPAYVIKGWKKEFMYDIPKAFNPKQDSNTSDIYMEKLSSRLTQLEKEKNFYKTNMEKFGL